MNVPTLVQLRDQLGRSLIAHPNSPLLHNANRTLNTVFPLRDKLKPAVKLGAARAVALALDYERSRTLTSGETQTFVCDLLDPAKRAELGWWAKSLVGDSAPPQRDLMLDLANALDHAQESLRNGLDETPLAIANALDRAHQAVKESAQNVGRGALDAVSATGKAFAGPAVIVVGVLLAWGFSRRRT